MTDLPSLNALSFVAYKYASVKEGPMNEERMRFKKVRNSSDRPKQTTPSKKLCGVLGSS